MWFRYYKRQIEDYKIYQIKDSNGEIIYLISVVIKMKNELFSLI